MSELKVGILALITMASVAYMSVFVTANKSGFGDYIEYRTVLENAAGIFPKTSIKVAGINAGRIKSIELSGRKALITFEILSKIKITESSQLKIKSVGFLGDKYIEIIPGVDIQETRLGAGLLMNAVEGGGVDDLAKEATQVLLDVKRITGALQKSFAPVGQVSPIKRILDDLSEISQSTRSVTNSLKSIVSGNETKLNNLISNLEKFSKDIAYQTNAEQSDSAMSDLKLILANAKNMTGDLQEVVNGIKNGQGTIGKFLVEDEIADEVKQTLASVQKIVGKVDAVRTELSVYTGANTRYGSETEASLTIYPSPERFYLLGIATSDFGPESEKFKTTIINGVSTDEIIKERTKDEYRFNVQIGRRIQNWGFRGGIIESSGGIGIDYNRLDWGSQFSAEVFDYREDIGVNFRLIAKFRIWNVFYGRLAVEDILESSRSGTISAGLKFNDEDLKGLMGFFL